MDNPRSRRAELDPLDNITGRDATLFEFGFLALRLAELLDHVGTKILIELYNLKLGFANFCFCLGDSGDQLPALAFDPCGLALQGRQPRQRYEPLVIQILHPRKFPCDQLQLLPLGRDLGIKACDLLAELRDTALQKVLLAVARIRSSLELRLLG